MAQRMRNEVQIHKQGTGQKRDPDSVDHDQAFVNLAIAQNQQREGAGDHKLEGDGHRGTDYTGAEGEQYVVALNKQKTSN